MHRWRTRRKPFPRPTSSTRLARRCALAVRRRSPGSGRSAFRYGRPAQSPGRAPPRAALQSARTAAVAKTESLGLPANANPGWRPSNRRNAPPPPSPSRGRRCRCARRARGERMVSKCAAGLLRQCLPLYPTPRTASRRRSGLNPSAMLMTGLAKPWLLCTSMDSIPERHKEERHRVNESAFARCVKQGVAVGFVGFSDVARSLGEIRTHGVCPARHTPSCKFAKPGGF